jgi:hypothetical protein
MAAGLVAKTTLLDTGDTSTVYFWAADTGSPDVNLYPVRVVLNSAGTPMDMGSGTGGTATQRVIIDSAQLDASVAHDAADSGNPSKIGYKAAAGLSGATLVTAADRVNAVSGLDGALYVRPHCGLEDLVSASTVCTAGANTSILASAGAGVKNYVMGGMIVNGGASAGNCIITDGSGGTTKLNIPFPASTGTVFTLPVPVGFSAATAVYADPSGSDNVTVTLYGFKSKV